MSLPVGPYTPIVEVGEWLICSGQIGVAGNPPELLDGDVGDQFRQAFANLSTVLMSKGAVPANVVKTTVFLISMDDYDLMNEAYVECFGDVRPARSAVAVAALPRGAKVEIEAWAHRAH